MPIPKGCAPRTRVPFPNRPEKTGASKFFNNLGKAYSKICKYMGLRAAAVGKGHHVIIDGTLKSNESTVNSLSDYSRKEKAEDG